MLERLTQSSRDRARVSCYILMGGDMRVYGRVTCAVEEATKGTQMGIFIKGSLKMGKLMVTAYKYG